MYGSPSAATAKELKNPFCHRKEEFDLEKQQQMSSGMLRYRSAPSSLLGEVCENFLETESMFARFVSPDLREKPHFKPCLETEQNRGFSSAPPPPNILYQSQQQHSVGGGTTTTSLIRQSSSPAGFFSQLNVENGYGMMKGMAGGTKGQISFTSRQNSLSQISEMGGDGFSGEERSPVENNNERCFIPGYHVSSWEDSLLSDTFSGFKRSRDVVGLNQTELQEGEVKNQHVSGLSHQLSLPKTSSEIAAMEKFLQFQDSVPCKIRAKRGCATHPRSIAERVRRTRISERMRKLQELVPNMDKQTNTADMLDLSVDYIKDLQRQVKTLTDSRASCTCSVSKQKPYQNTS